MIFQSFNKGGTDRNNFGLHEYVAGADIIFDFGNIVSSISASAPNYKVYNVASQNVTGSLIPYNNPGPFYPTYSGSSYGVMNFKSVGGLNNYMRYQWKSTQEQTNIFCLQTPSPDGESQYPNEAAGANSIYVKINTFNNVFVGMYDSANTQYDDIFGAPTINKAASNGRNGWNMITVTSNGSNVHQLYINETLTATSNVTINRVTSGAQTFNFSTKSNNPIMSFLQYPKILTPKQIRQTYKVFNQRFFVP
jgi:hypothetical protein